MHQHIISDNGPTLLFCTMYSFAQQNCTAPVLTPLTLLVVDHPLSISLSTATTNVKQQHPIQIIHRKTIQVFVMFYFLYWGLSAWVENPYICAFSLLHLESLLWTR